MTTDPATPAAPQHLDGSAAAGDLAEMFGADISGAMGTCSSCGQRGAIGQAHAYLDCPGAVLRCPHCDNVLIRWATTPVATWLEMPGLRLEIAGA